MIVERRLLNQRLIGSTLRTPQAVVSWLTAVQAQDFPGARWALGLRAPGVTDAAVMQAVASGDILRTHVLRPTWHFVARDDIRWLLALTAPRILASLAFRQRYLELDAKTLARSRAVLGQALEGGRSMTRTDIAAALRRGRIATTPERLAHILIAAELEAVVCSGRPEKGQHTYALLDERVPASPAKDRDEAVALLARRYLESHGPATAADFAWWSGLTLRDARGGFELAGRSEERAPRRRAGARPRAWLLPAFDEYLVAYRDRTAALQPHVTDFRDALGPTVLIDGIAVANWRRSTRPGRTLVELLPRRRLSAAELDAVQRATRPYATFLALDPGSVTLSNL